MIIEIDIPDYDGNSIDIVWEKGAKYIATYDNDNVIIKANSEGLLSLARQMIYLAVNAVPSGSHAHYDSFFTTEETVDKELILEKLC